MFPLQFLGNFFDRVWPDVGTPLLRAELVDLPLQLRNLALVDVALAVEHGHAVALETIALALHGAQALVERFHRTTHVRNK